MKIALIGPGIMEIPPNGWGAVEMLIWDYTNILRDLGHRVEIINTPDRELIKFEVEHGRYDVVHLHYDVFQDIIEDLVPLCKALVVSSHYPFLNVPARWGRDGYGQVFKTYSNNKDFTIFASSQKDINTFVEYGNAVEENIWLSKLGVRPGPYQFNDYASFDTTLCFSQICDRKRQYLMQDWDNIHIDIFGRREYGKFNNDKNFRGEMPREILYQNITNYSNFILLSEVENTTPLVVKEALICGLGVVVSEAVTPELDTSKSFIDVIPESEINNQDYIKDVVVKNKRHSRQIRREIREYGIHEFGLENILAYEYIPKLESLL
jgi:hypothetical protein